LRVIPKSSVDCFEGDPEDRLRDEDDLIAWTWRRFLDDPSDPDILIRLPMVKVGEWPSVCTR